MRLRAGDTLRVLAVAILGIAGLLPAAAFATICNVAGEVQVLSSPPPSVDKGALPNDDLTHVFLERDDHVLTTSVSADAKDYGPYAFPYQLGSHSIASGTEVDTHYLHFDPIVSLWGIERVSGVVDFCENILGVFVLGGSLFGTHGELGAPIVYPSPIYLDGLEFNAQRHSDFFAILPSSGTNKKRLLFTLGASLDLDTLRVVTMSPGIPGT